MLTALASLLERDSTIHKMFSSVMSNSLQKCSLMWLSLKHELTHSSTLCGEFSTFILISFSFQESVFTAVLYVRLFGWCKGFIFDMGWFKVKVPIPFLY
jgi:hypothetical protein